MKIKSILMAFAAATSLSQAASVSIANNSFENPSFGGGFASKNLDNWDHGGLDSGQIPGVYAYINANAWILQDITTALGGATIQVGDTFEVTLDSKNNTNVEFDIRTGVTTASQGTSLLGGYTSLATNTDGVTALGTVDTATTDPVFIVFFNDVGQAHIDNISLDYTAVPEPSSTALLGLGGLALIMRRRK